MALALHTNRATRFGLSTLGSVRLDQPLPANDTATPLPPIRWINVANEGEYKGHHQGEFELTPEVFAQLIANFRADPKYKLGDIEVDGAVLTAGCQGVVQYDYEHASEMAPWEGSIPTSGAPAIGWVLELEVRPGPEGAQLWALSKLGEQIRGQIQRDEYHSVSIAWNPAGVHWQTGEPIGAVLTSIAFTNHPFLRDLELIAASSRMAGQTPRGGVQPRAQSPEAHGDGPPTHQGVPMTEELRRRLCSMYRLAPAADDDSIIRAAENASTTGGTLATILQALGVSDPAAAQAAIPELVSARSKLVEMLAELDGLMQSDAAQDAAVAEQDVGAAMAARGWNDPQALVAVHSHRLSIVAGEIAKLPKRKDSRGHELSASVGDQRAARERGRQAFFSQYGVNTQPQLQHLTQTFVAGPGLVGHQQYLPQLPPPAPSVQGYVPGQPVYPQQLRAPLVQQQQLQPLPIGAGGYPQQLQPQTVDLSQYTGRNTTERIISYLSSVDPKIDALPIGAKISRASAWRQQHMPAN